MASPNSNFYGDLVHRFSLLSNGKFNPVSIEEKWLTKNGPVELSYLLDGLLVILRPDISTGWLDHSIVKHLKKQVESKGVQLYQLEQSEGTLLRLNKTEKSVLENKFDWRFK